MSKLRQERHSNLPLLTRQVGGGLTQEPASNHKAPLRPRCISLLKEEKKENSRDRAEPENVGKGLRSWSAPEETPRVIVAPLGALFFFLQLHYQDASAAAKHHRDHQRLPTLRQGRGRLRGAQPRGAQRAPGARVCRCHRGTVPRQVGGAGGLPADRKLCLRNLRGSC